MSRIESNPPTLTGYGATANRHQAGADAVNADRTVLTRQYAQLRSLLVHLHCAAEPDLVAIDHAIDRLAHLQSEIKATYGLIGNNPIED